MPHILIYKARDGWRWRAVAGNGRIVAESGEAYTRRRGLMNGLSKARVALCSEIREAK